MQAASIRGTALAAAETVDAKALFDWAAWKYSALFPAGGQDFSLIYQGQTFTVRAFSNGNHLGLTPAGEIFGLGPFTQQALLHLGHVSAFAGLVEADFCPMNPGTCQAPVISAEPLNVHALAGQAAIFSAEAVGTPGVRYQWQVSTDQGSRYNDIAGATAARYTTPALTATDDGRRYRVRIHNAAGSVTSRDAGLIVRGEGASRWYPDDPGSRWAYARGSGSGRDTVQMVGTELVNGQLGAVYELQDQADGSRWREIYVSSADGVRLHHPGTTTNPISRAMSGELVLRLPVQVGSEEPLTEATVSSGMDLDRDGRMDDVHVVARLATLAWEPMPTPAAHFNSTLHLRQTLVITYLLSSGLPPVTTNGVQDLWLAEGIGPVKITSRLSAPGMQDELITQTLAEFQVGALRSDLSAPGPRLAVPGPATARSQPTR